MRRLITSIPKKPDRPKTTGQGEGVMVRLHPQEQPNRATGRRAPRRCAGWRARCSTCLSRRPWERPPPPNRPTRRRFRRTCYRRRTTISFLALAGILSPPLRQRRVCRLLQPRRPSPKKVMRRQRRRALRYTPLASRFDWAAPIEEGPPCLSGCPLRELRMFWG
jgi:hypothetical protein